MSTEIEQRVVEMRFDNKHFESNVSTTMSTLDKLKQKLHLDGATRGLENVNTAAKNVNMAGLGAGVEAVSMKFSALQVIGVTALTNITNSAVNAGKRIVSALTIDPVKTGFQEYETKMGSIQTILANTEHQGTTMDDVTAALEELNLYADKTIYNFQEMTRNIGTFTAAGVDLQTSVKSIQGIANLAAVSGSTSQQASTAMYQLSQALATGTVKLMDWNSVVNAGMGGKVFQNALIRTAAMLDGAASDVEAWQAKNVDAYGSFRDSLSQGAWLTSEVLTETLKQFTMSAEEGTEEWEAFKKSLMEQGYAEAQAEEILKMANTATDAATKVKTFTQLFDTLKESAQSGWAQTWELLFGDFEEAKEFFTGLSDMIGGLVNSMSEYRNNMLGGVLDSNWDKLIGKLGKAGIKSTEYEEKIREVLKAHGETDDSIDALVDKYGSLSKAIKSGAISSDILKEALAKFGIGTSKTNEKIAGFIEGLEKIERLLGWGAVGDDVKALQTALEKLGHSVGKCGIDGIIGPDTTAAIKEFQKEAGIAVDGIAGPETLAALKKAGKSFEDVAGEAKDADASYDELVDNITKKGGRELFLESFGNAINGLVGTFRALGTAWAEIFPASEAQSGLFKALETINKFTQSLRLFEEVVDENGNSTIKFNENGEKLVRTFKGVFAILDVVTTLLSGGLKIAFKVITQILEFFDLNILDLTASIGDALVAFRDWFESLFDISGILEKIGPIVKAAADAISKWFDAFKNSAAMQRAIAYITDIGIGIQEWWANLKDAEDLPRTIAEGIVNFFSNLPKIISTVGSEIWNALTESFNGGIGDSPLSGFVDSITNGLGIAGQTIVELGKLMLERLNNFLSERGFKTISEDAIAGLIEGLRDGASRAWNAAVEMAMGLVQKVKDFLGIHSPSTVFAAIGGFIIAGLIAGLQNGIPDSFGAFKDIFQPMLDWLGGLDFGAIIASVMGVFSVGTVYKAVSALEAIASPFEGLGEIFEGTGKILKKSAGPIKKILNNTAKVVKSFSGVLNATAFSIRMDGIKTLVESLLLLIGAIIVLTFFDAGELLKAVGLVAALAVILVGLAWAMDKISDSSASITKEGIDIKGLSSGLIGIGTAILLMAVAVKLMGSLDPEQAKQGFLALAGVVVAMAAVIAAFGLLVKGDTAENFDKFGKTMTKMSIALLIMAAVVRLLGGMDQDVLIQGGVAILAFGGIVVGLIAATKLLGSKNIEHVGGAILKMALAIGAMAVVTKMLGEMDRETLIQGGIAIIAFGGIIVGLMAATKLISGSKHVDAIGGTLLKIAIAIGVMALVAKMLAGMETGDLVKGTLAVAAFGGMIVGLMAATKLISGSKNIDKIGKSILAVSGAIAIMALTAFMLSMISWEGFAKGTIMITAFAGIVVGLMAATRLLTGSKNVDTIGKTLISVAGAIAILALVAVLISLVPVENLVRGTIIVSVLSLLMMGLIAVTSIAKNCLGNLIVLTIAIAVMAGAVYLISTIPAESAITSALVLGGLMVVMTGVLAALSVIGGFAISALIGIGLLTVMAIPLLAFVGVLALMQNVQNATENANALVALLTAMAAVLVVLALVGPLALIGVNAMTALVGLIVGVGLLATAIGALVTQFPQLQTFLDTGIPILEQLAHGLGSIIGNFITGFAGEVMTILPQLGMCLSQFMVNATDFIAGAKLIDESVLTGVGILAGAVIALTAADLIAGVSSFLQGGSSFAELGTQLSQFMINAMPFITAAASLTPEMTSGVKSLAETILILTAADVIQGLASFLTGGSSLENFAAQLPVLGRGLAAFSTNIGVFTEDQLNTVKCASNAIKTLAQASNEIPNAGGLLGQLVGENDLGTFAAQFPILGTGIAQFLANVGTFTEDQVTTVTCAANAIKALAQASNEIPNAGGLIGQLVGENDLSTFAEQFPVLGTGLRSFLDNIGTFTDDQVATTTCAANAIKSLAEAANAIPNEGGWISKLIGDNSLGSFAEQFPSLGTGLRGFIDNVGTFTDAQVTTINAAINAIKALSNLANADLSGASKHLSGFSDDLPGFASDVADFCSNMPSSDIITSAVTGVDKLLSAVESIANANSGCLATFADNLKKVGKNAVDKFVEAFTNNAVKTDLKDAAKKLGDKVVEGIEAKESAIEKAAKNAAKKAVDGVETQEDDMKSAGKDLGKGLVNGIKAKWDAAYDAGYTLGQKAVQGEKDGQESQSPSKATIRAGKWLGEGLVIGIGKMARAVYNAGNDLGNTATGTISSAVSWIADMVSNDIDAQPTIRPVLDLSDVEAGVGAIGGMFGSPMGTLNMAGRINASMSNRSQNGVNGDVVSELSKLRNDLNKINSTTYNVNGVTYDDGSNVFNAVKTIVRAARIERRV